MENEKNNPAFFDEAKSFQLIMEMIEVSRKKLKTDGMLFIVWGWVNFLTCFIEYLSGVIIHTHQISVMKHWVSVVLPVCAISFTIFYIIKSSRKATTYIHIALRYVWISVFFAMVLVNLIQFNVLHKIVFELQHAIFMVLISFAIIITGALLRRKIVVAGGILFALVAYLCSCLPLNTQLLVESLAWLCTFAIPGHILYSQRKRQ